MVAMPVIGLSVRSLLANFSCHAVHPQGRAQEADLDRAGIDQFTSSRQFQDAFVERVRARIGDRLQGLASHPDGDLQQPLHQRSRDSTDGAFDVVSTHPAVSHEAHRTPRAGSVMQHLAGVQQPGGTLLVSGTNAMGTRWNRT